MTLQNHLGELETLLRQNNGKYLVFEGDQPKMVLLDPNEYQKFVSSAVPGEKILVTGGAGYIGSHTVRRLQELGNEVIVLDNLSAGHMESVNCPLIVGDLMDSGLLDKIFDQNRISAVVHFAGSIEVEESVRNPEKYFRNNVVGSLNLLNCMVKHSVNSIVYSSSAAVYGSPKETPISEDQTCSPTNPYGESKRVFEKILNWYHQAHGISAVIFRYFNAAGGWPEENLGENHPNETHLIPRILRVANKQEESLKVFGDDYPTADGTAVRDYIHVRDLAEAHALAISKLIKERGLFTYNVGTGHGYSVSEIVNMVMDVTGKMVTIQKSPRRAGDPPALVADNAKITKELGFSPKYSDLKTIISSAWEWHQKLYPKFAEAKLEKEKIK